MSLQRRRQRYVVILMRKILHRNCPNDISIELASPSRQGIKALVSVLSRSSFQRNQSLNDLSFSFMGPRLWNSSPNSPHAIVPQTILPLAATASATISPWLSGTTVRGQRYCRGGLEIRWPRSGTSKQTQVTQVSVKFLIN